MERVLRLGDSITVGLSHSGELRRLVPDAFVFVGSQEGPDGGHEGHVGRTIGFLLARVDSWLETHRPNAVVLMIGTNDVAGTEPVGSLLVRLTQLLDRIVSKGVRLVVSTIPPAPRWKERESSYNDGVRILAARLTRAGRDVGLADVRRALAETDLTPDRVHLNPAGNRKAAAAIASALAALPARGKSVWIAAGLFVLGILAWTWPTESP